MKKTNYIFCLLLVFCSTSYAGVAGGAAGALTNSLLNGANIGQIAKNTFTGAFWGGASGFFNFASGSGTLLEKLFKHAFSQGCMEAVQGGNAFHGFMLGAVSCLGSDYTNRSSYQPKLAKLATSAAISGCIDEIGGGKFANGAVTGAFSFLFNDYMHCRSTVDEVVETYMVYFAYDISGCGTASMIVKSRAAIDNYIQEKKLKMTLSLSYRTYCPEEFIGAFETHLYLGHDYKGEIFYENVIRHSIMMPGTNYAGLKHLECNYEAKVPQVKIVITGSWKRRNGFHTEMCNVHAVGAKFSTFTHLIKSLFKNDC